MYQIMCFFTSKTIIMNSTMTTVSESITAGIISMIVLTVIFFVVLFSCAIFIPIIRENNFIGIDDQNKIYSNTWDPRLVLFHRCLDIKRYARKRHFIKYLNFDVTSMDNIKLHIGVECSYQLILSESDRLAELIELKNMNLIIFVKETIKDNIRNQFKNILLRSIVDGKNLDTLIGKIKLDNISTKSYIHVRIFELICFIKNNEDYVLNIKLSENIASFVYYHQDDSVRILENKKDNGTEFIDLEI